MVRDPGFLDRKRKRIPQRLISFRHDPLRVGVKKINELTKEMHQ